MSATDKIMAKTYQQGETIISEGDRDKQVFLIISGSAEIYKTVGENRQLLNVIGNGEIFGEMGPLTNEPRYASVIAAEETKLIIVQDKTFHNALLNDKLPIIKPLTKQLASRLKDAEKQNQEYLKRIKSLELELASIQNTLREFQHSNRKI